MPDDPFITEMDPVQKLWMFYSWVEERKEIQNAERDQAYLIGGFVNPSLLQKMLNEDSNSISTSDEDFEQSLKIIKDSHQDTENTASLKRKRRRKKIGT
jgi:hypothetical protein